MVNTPINRGCLFEYNNFQSVQTSINFEKSRTLGKKYKSMKKLISIITMLTILNIEGGYGQLACHTESTIPPGPPPLECVFASYYNDSSFLPSSKLVRIYFNVLRDAQGNGGVSEADVIESFNILNYDFIDSEISFQWDGCINYIDDDALFTTSDYSQILNPLNQDGVDIYIGPLNHPFTGGIAKTVGATNGGSASFLVGHDWSPVCSPETEILTSSTSILSHEMGHVFGLYHVWEVLFNKPLNNECESNGDCICDTPAAQNLDHQVDSNCMTEIVAQDGFVNLINNHMQFTNV